MYKHTMRKGNKKIVIEVIEGCKVQSTLWAGACVHSMTSDAYEDLNKATLAAFEWVNFHRAGA